uniref:LY6/PLAUR domain containing 6 n=1 Tax=Oryzias sinensis TaxID=183150 RepID=A0A8C7YTZ3_9TELE
ESLKPLRNWMVFPTELCLWSCADTASPVKMHQTTTSATDGLQMFSVPKVNDNACSKGGAFLLIIFIRVFILGTMYCYTRHMMDDNGGSVSVTKRCATLENCQLTGCVNVTHTGYQMCTSCCEGNICNIMVPRNDSSAVFSSTSPLVSSGRGLNPAGLIFFIIVVAWTCLH